jgi:VWFA-related protein
MAPVVPLRARALGVLAVLAFAAALLRAQDHPAITITGSEAPETTAASQTADPQAQKPDRQEIPATVFKSTVRRVIVDVVVTDSKGKPIPGLEARDFSIAEDGKPQKILSFDVHNLDSISGPIPAKPNLPVNTFMNLPSGPERGPLYVLLLDLLNLDVDDQPTARKQLLTFMLHKPMGTRFAVFVLSDGLHLAQGFTEDRNLLARAIDPQDAHSHLPKIFLLADNYRPYYSIPRVLVGLSQWLADLPGHKNIIWFSGSFPSVIFGSEAESYQQYVQEAVDAMARGQIAVYPVDVRGVVPISPGAGATGSGAASGGADGGNSSDVALNARYMTEEELANATGGRAFYSTNDLASALSEATEIGAHYYTLSYSPTNADFNGKLRHIRVELAHRGYSLAYRRAYFGSRNFVEPGASETRSAADELAAIKNQVDPLNLHMQRGAPMEHQLLFRVHVRPRGPAAKATPQQMAKLAGEGAGKSGAGKLRQPVELQTYRIDYAIAAREKSLEVAATAFDEDGKALNGVVQRVAEDEIGPNDGENHEGIFRIQQEIDVPTTAVSMRLGVRDLATDNVGALEIHLPLPPEPPSDRASTRNSGPASQAQDQ